jgi:hypothetical protein
MLECSTSSSVGEDVDGSAARMELVRHEVLTEWSVEYWNELTQKRLTDSREK